MTWLHRHYWQVERIMTREDAWQECAVVFLKMLHQYPDVVDAPHQMAMYKAMLYRRWTDLAHTCTSVREGEVNDSAQDSEDDLEAWSRIAHTPGELDVVASVRQQVSTMPPDVRAVLSLFMNGPDDIVDELVRQINGGPRLYSRACTRVQALLGLKCADPISLVRGYFLSGV